MTTTCAAPEFWEEQKKQTVKIEKYTSTYALNSIKKQREFHKVK